jgi:hypothetical protein
MSNRYLSVKQCANVLGLNIKTIQTWLNRRILVPEQVAKRRDPVGHQLSISDVVTVWILHVLFSHGAKFQHMSRLHAGSFTFHTQDFSTEPLRQLNLAEEKSRHIQTYLELIDPPFLAYMLRVDRQMVLGEDPIKDGHIFFYPESKIEEIFERVMTTTGLTSHLILNVGAIHRYISCKIKESG